MTYILRSRNCDGGERVDTTCSSCVHGICVAAFACELPETTRESWLRRLMRRIADLF